MSRYVVKVMYVKRTKRLIIWKWGIYLGHDEGAQHCFRSTTKVLECFFLCARDYNLKIAEISPWPHGKDPLLKKNPGVTKEGQFPFFFGKPYFFWVGDSGCWGSSSSHSPHALLTFFIKWSPVSSTLEIELLLT